jgi:hypothetical protein
MIAGWAIAVPGAEGGFVAIVVESWTTATINCLFDWHSTDGHAPRFSAPLEASVLVIPSLRSTSHRRDPQWVAQPRRFVKSDLLPPAFVKKSGKLLNADWALCPGLATVRASGSHSDPCGIAHKPNSRTTSEFSSPAAASERRYDRHGAGVEIHVLAFAVTNVLTQRCESPDLAAPKCLPRPTGDVRLFPTSYSRYLRKLQKATSSAGAYCLLCSNCGGLVHISS